MINLKQSVFCTTYSLKILVLERKYKNNLKNRESQKIYIFQCSYIYICNVYLVFYYEIQWCYQDFKSEYLFFKSVLSSHSEDSGPVTRDHVKSSQMMNETPLQL